MPNKRVSDDIDHVPIDPKPSNILKKKPPPLGSTLKHISLLINNLLLNGHGELPSNVRVDAHYAILVYSIIMIPSLLSEITGIGTLSFTRLTQRS